MCQPAVRTRTRRCSLPVSCLAAFWQGWRRTA
nr:MAG TPA: Minor nucleoprotein VP30, VP30, SSGCID, Seattle Structural.25A [Caudoviricetes sp.]